MESVIEEAFRFGEPYVHAAERGNFRMFLHELLTNTFSYAISGITPEARDSQAITTPPRVQIPERRAIKVMLAVDEEKVGFSVSDSTGSLSMVRLLEKLRRQTKIAGESLPLEFLMRQAEACPCFIGTAASSSISCEAYAPRRFSCNTMKKV